jgi:hypothetical protein
VRLSSAAAFIAGLSARLVELWQVSISKQLLQRVSCFRFARVVFGWRAIFAANHFEIFAVIREMFFGDRIGAAIAALLRHASVVTDAIETNFQVRAALMARLGPTRRAAQFVFSPAFPTMSCQSHFQ